MCWGKNTSANVRYMSIITFRRDVLHVQVGYSPLSLYYILLMVIMLSVSGLYRIQPRPR